jgi:hypothetical protein
MNEQGQSFEAGPPDTVGAKDAVGATATRGKRAKPSATRGQQDAERKLRETTEKTKQAAQQIGDRLSETAAEAADRGKEQGQKFLDQQKDKVASEISAYSEAARRAADRLDSDSDTNLSRYVSSAADHLDRLGRRIRERSVGGLMDDVEDIARQRPEIFYGGLFVAGLATARFLKASKRQRQRDTSESARSSRVGYRSQRGGVAEMGARDDLAASWNPETSGATAPWVGTPATGLPSSTTNEGSTGGNI